MLCSKTQKSYCLFGMELFCSAQPSPQRMGSRDVFGQPGGKESQSQPGVRWWFGAEQELAKRKKTTAAWLKPLKSPILSQVPGHWLWSKKVGYQFVPTI